MTDKDGKQLNKAANVLQQGGIVAFPTETYYGLAVDPFNEKALERLFAVKLRSRKKPVLVLIDKVSMLEQLASSIPQAYQVLIRTFWPGPLTLVFPARKHIPRLLTGNTETIGVRQSSHPIANALVSLCGRPITATSANISGRRAASSGNEVRQQFGVTLDYILDCGPTPGGQGSTIVGMQKNRICCLRSGVIPWSNIRGSIAHDA